MKKVMETRKNEKKAYVKPQVTKHTPASQVVGSSSGDCLYASNTFVGLTYYH